MQAGNPLDLNRVLDGFERLIESGLSGLPDFLGAVCFVKLRRKALACQYGRRSNVPDDRETARR